MAINVLEGNMAEEKQIVPPSQEEVVPSMAEATNEAVAGVEVDAADSAIKYKLQDFEGPLDLLLFLVHREMLPVQLML